MKIALYALLALGMISQSALANTSASNPGYSNRYVTTYGRWDHAVYETYSYRETTTVSTTCNYYTCYENMTTTTNVWVEERVITEGRYRGHHVVNVYRDGGYNDLYATYYVDHSASRPVIYRRNFVRHSYYRDPYYYPGYTVVYAEIDAATAAIITGTYVAVLGAEIIASCPDNVVCLGIGAALSASGSASSLWGSSMAHGEATALQRRLDAMNRSDSNPSDIR
ncbi:MAG: hypothetical protein AABZ55_13425 [Bdellovibrionota bacterium]